MRLPWVSRRYAEFLEQTVERLQRERDEQQTRADRAVDNVFLAAGQAPVSTGVREDIAKDRALEETYLAGLNLEDDTAGMLDVDWVERIAGVDGKVVTN